MKFKTSHKLLLLIICAAIPSILYFALYSPFPDSYHIPHKKEATEAVVPSFSSEEEAYISFLEMKLPDLSDRKVKSGPRYHDRIKINPLPGRLPQVFNDSNRLQYAYASMQGIKPLHNIYSAYNSAEDLIAIRSCDFYEVDSLRHSMPYLVPHAALLLRTIGRNFIDSLANRGADGHRIIVTSLLRTPASVKRLRRVNVNATDSSTHQFGTTFDITYTRFAVADSTRTIHEEDLKNLLAEVLYDLREQGLCFVKFERHTACFHITAIKR